MAQSFDIKTGEYIILTAAGGVFSGIVAVRDLTDFLVDITNKDIEMAGLLQERLIASVDDTKNHNLNINAWSRSAKGISGDFYIIKNLKKNLLFSAICDVSGKGIAASLIVAMAWGYLQAAAVLNGLKELLINLNTSVINTFQLEKYLTGFFLVDDSSRRRLQIADMGHAHSAFIRKNRVFPLQQTKVNFPIGVEVDINPAVYSLTVQEGDALLVYTDGIPEQDNPQGEEFGEDRLLKLVKKCIQEKKDLTEILPACIDDFRRNIPQHDDMTFLLFRFY
jgi:sigma-B regulation protein RsbU (phosphoserine phosphatase)